MSDQSARRQHTDRLYEAFVAADFDTLREDLHPEAEFVNPDDAVEPGTRHGPAGFVKAMKGVHEQFHYDGVEIVEFVERADSAVAHVRFRVRGRGSDTPVDAAFAHLLTWDGDLLRRLEWFRSRDEAVVALP